jgi:hypothetical protein
MVSILLGLTKLYVPYSHHAIYIGTQVPWCATENYGTIMCLIAIMLSILELRYHGVQLKIMELYHE